MESALKAAKNRISGMNLETCRKSKSLEEQIPIKFSISDITENGKPQVYSTQQT